VIGELKDSVLQKSNLARGKFGSTPFITGKGGKGMMIREISDKDQIYQLVVR